MSVPERKSPIFPNPTILPSGNDELKATPKFNKVMSEYGKGELTSSSGAPVTNQKQAVAIAASESHQSYKDKQKQRSKADRYGMVKR
jgi:hypothetical protein